MYLLFVILIVIASVLMIGIVLIQESKGGGLSSNFASSNQIMGVRKTTDFIEKATWGLAIAMVVLSVLCAYVAPESVTEQSAVEATTDNPLTLPTTQQNFNATQKSQDQGKAAAADAKAPVAPAADAKAPAAPAAPQK